MPSETDRRNTLILAKSNLQIDIIFQTIRRNVIKFKNNNAQEIKKSTRKDGGRENTRKTAQNDCVFFFCSPQTEDGMREYLYKIRNPIK